MESPGSLPLNPGVPTLAWARLKDLEEGGLVPEPSSLGGGAGPLTLAASPYVWGRCVLLVVWACPCWASGPLGVTTAEELLPPDFPSSQFLEISLFGDACGSARTPRFTHTLALGWAVLGCSPPFSGSALCLVSSPLPWTRAHLHHLLTPALRSSRAATDPHPLGEGEVLVRPAWAAGCCLSPCFSSWPH